MNKNIIDMKISDIRIKDRQRKDMGDLEGFAQSIEETGLLQPIGITPDYRLIFGLRRLLAYRDVMKLETIPARIIEVESVLHAQIAEGVMRKDYTISERVAIVEALRSFKHGGDRRSNQDRKCDVELTVDKAAKRAGLGGKDGYARAKKVIDNGVPRLVEAMDKGEIAVSAAAKIAELPADDQGESVRHGKPLPKRDPHDFYPTPPCVTEALLEQERFTETVWEPACGDGALSEVLKHAGYDVVSSDLIARGYGEVENFLESARESRNVITNPPFTLAEQFVEKALAATTGKVAMFLPLTFLEGRRRHKLLSSSPLKTVYVFTDRVSLYKGGATNRGGGRAAFAWFVWEHGHVGPPTISWITSERQKPVVVRPPEQDVLPLAKVTSITVNSVTEGDCRDLIPALPDGSINLCLCSPPYAERRNRHYPGVPEGQYPDFTVQWMAKLWDKLADDGSVLIVIDPHVKDGSMADYVLRTQLALREAGWKQPPPRIWFKRDRGPIGRRDWPRHVYEDILWFTKTPNPFCDPRADGKLTDHLTMNNYAHSRWTNGGKPGKKGVARVTDVIDVPIGGNAKGVKHPAKFPIALPEQLITTYCPPEGTVLDNFCGSGSTLIAAKKLGRAFYGFDIEAESVELSRGRLDELDQTEPPSLPQAG